MSSALLLRFRLVHCLLRWLAGKAKAIGVSNWSIPYLETLSQTWKVVPAVNQVRRLLPLSHYGRADLFCYYQQVELHPFNPQHELKAWCDKRGILLEAYCPLGSTSE